MFGYFTVTVHIIVYKLPFFVYVSYSFAHIAQRSYQLKIALKLLLLVLNSRECAIFPNKRIGLDCTYDAFGFNRFFYSQDVFMDKTYNTMTIIWSTFLKLYEQTLITNELLQKFSYYFCLHHTMLSTYRDKTEHTTKSFKQYTTQRYVLRPFIFHTYY